MWKILISYAKDSVNVTCWGIIFSDVVIYNIALQSRINIKFQSYIKMYIWVDSVNCAEMEWCLAGILNTQSWTSPLWLAVSGSGGKSVGAGESCSVCYCEVLAPPCPLHLEINPHWAAQGHLMPGGFLCLEKATKQPGSQSSTVA